MSPPPARPARHRAGIARRSTSLAFAASLAVGGFQPLAAAADFSTSFEDSEAIKPLENSVEMIDRNKPFQQQVKGRAADPLMDGIAAVSASSENGPGESAARAADDEPGSKWLTFQATGWLQ